MSRKIKKLEPYSNGKKKFNRNDIPEETNLQDGKLNIRNANRSLKKGKRQSLKKLIETELDKNLDELIEEEKEADHEYALIMGYI